MYIGMSVRVLGNDHFRIYLAGLESKVLIEGGVSGIIPVVRQQANAMGREASHVSQVVVMHAHFDHVCGIPGLLEIFTQAETSGSAIAAEILSRPKIVAGFFREDSEMSRTLGGDAGGACAGGGLPKIDIQNIIRDGTVWTLGKGFSLRFAYAPGHSPCSMTAYCPEEEILFSSDSAGFPVEKNMIFPIFFDGYWDYVQSIKRMMEIPVSVLAGAHEEIVFGQRQVKDYLQMALDWAEKTKEFVIRENRRGRGREELSKKIYDMFYRGRLKIYTRENIMLCSGLIVKRSIEAEKG
ncbi:MAG: MBL fold metallo-hydrolase [Bacillota bacterium]